MSDSKSEITQEIQPTTAPQKLYAGKFKTTEELEEGYKASLPLYQQNEKLKSDLTSATKVPDDYLIPQEATLSEGEISEIKRIAKNTGLTQNHFDKLVMQTQQHGNAMSQKFEVAKKEVGESTLNILKDYVTKNYPEALQANVMNQLITDQNARNSALSHREKLLNTAVPGMNQYGATHYKVTDDDIKKARAKVENSRGAAKVEAQSFYLNLLSQKVQEK
jgi:hypothetical protein